MSKDWIGNKKSIFACHGASNHTEEERQIDDYVVSRKRGLYKRRSYRMDRIQYDKSITVYGCRSAYNNALFRKRLKGKVENK